MRFPYQEFPRNPSEAFPEGKTRSVSLIPVRVSLDGGPAFTIDALVDSGADNCIFPGMLGVALGINVHGCPKQLISGLGGRIIEARFHDIDLSVGNTTCRVYAGFSFDTIGISGLLGQRGFFDNFRITFDRAENCVIVNRRTPLQRLFTKLGL